MRRLPGYKVPDGLDLLDACLQGNAALSNYVDFWNDWHAHKTSGSPHRILGLTDHGLYQFLRNSRSMFLLEGALTCRRLGYPFDSVWTMEKIPELLELCQRIADLKAELHDQRHMTNASTSDKLDALGELIAEKNVLTGIEEDVAYLRVDNGEYLFYVAGFIGQETPLVDSNGTPLLVGDTVAYPDGWDRMLILHEDGTPIFHQEELLKRRAIKKTPCWDCDLTASWNLAFEVTKESCLERYQRLHPADAPAPGGMELRQG